MRKLIIALITILFLTPCFAKVYGPTKSTDHLWKIALQERPSKNVTVQQVMVAIYRHNQRAFLRDNMNGLKAGYYLHVPTLKTIKKTSPQRAIIFVHRQNQYWEKGQLPPKHKVVLQTHKVKPVSNLKIEQNRRAIKELTLLQLRSQQAMLELHKQVTITNKAMINLNTRYQMRISNLEQNNSSLQENMQQVSQKLQNMGQNVDTLNQQLQQSQDLDKQHQVLYNKLFMILAGVIVVLAILIIILSFTRRKGSKTIDEDKGDYDFMGSEESIPAKLDLARSYIDMDDKKAAKKILKEIKKHGNQAQQEEAEKLLEQTKK